MLTDALGPVFAPSVSGYPGLMSRTDPHLGPSAHGETTRAGLMLAHAMTTNPKKSALPPARVGLLVIILGIIGYGLITLMG